MTTITRIKTTVVDCDTHFFQPIETWQDYIHPRYKDQVIDYMNNPLNLQVRKSMTPLYEAIKGGDDSAERLKWMDSEGIYANIIYPGAGFVTYMENPDGLSAACRALNQWAANFAKRSPDRLKPCMVLPFRYPDRALEELRYATQELNLQVVFAAPAPLSDRRWSDTVFDPVWQGIQDAGAVMTYHEFSVSPSGNAIVRKSYDLQPLKYLCGHTVEAQLCIMDLIFGGVFERFPRLQVGLVEAHVAWLPGWLMLMDSLVPRFEQYFKQQFANATTRLSQAPSAYFRRQCFAVAFPDDIWVEENVKYIGEDNITICTDFPHPQTRYELLAKFRDNQSRLPEKVQRKILGENAARIFQLQG